MQFSIIIPSFNQAKFLQPCLESVIGQRDVDLEVLVLDGGSNDGSKEIIERYAKRLAYWRSYPDGGQSAALREGFALAKGDILGWVNSDDMLLPGALRTVAECMQQHPKSPMVYGDAIWINEKGRIIRPKREIDFCWAIFAYGYCYMPQPSTFFRRAIYHNVGGIDASLMCSMDYDLWHRLSAVGPVVHNPRFLSAIRHHQATKTNRLKAVFDKEHEILRTRYLNCSAAGYRLRHVWYRALRVVWRFVAGSYRKITQEEASRCGLSLHM